MFTYVWITKAHFTILLANDIGKRTERNVKLLRQYNGSVSCAHRAHTQQRRRHLNVYRETCWKLSLLLSVWQFLNWRRLKVAWKSSGSGGWWKLLSFTPSTTLKVERREYVSIPPTRRVVPWWWWKSLLRLLFNFPFVDTAEKREREREAFISSISHLAQVVVIKIFHHVTSSIYARSQHISHQKEKLKLNFQDEIITRYNKFNFPFRLNMKTF